MKEDFKEWLLTKQVQKWMDNNKSFCDDIQKLVSECLLFEVKYGFGVALNLKKPQEYYNKKFHKS